MSIIKAVIVDDSAFFRKAVDHVLQDDPRIQVMGMAASGEELLENLERWKPDVITLDLSMPGMGGLATLDQVMLRRPTPVIILSTHSAKDAPMTIEALHRGAVDFIDKQEYSLMNLGALREVMVEKILWVTRGVINRPSAEIQAPAPQPQPATQSVPATQSAPRPATEAPPEPQSFVGRRFEALLVGASTGGPPAIQALLESLGPMIPVPVAIVQHMPTGFTAAFASRLNAHMPFAVREAQHGDYFVAGTVYIAPAGLHMRFKQEGGKVFISLTQTPSDTLHRPSIDIMFETAAKVIGRRALGVLLTGMGRDGAEGLLKLSQSGAFTIAQDEGSSIVYGMPKAAIEIGAAKEQVALPKMGERISTILKTGMTI